MVGVGQVKGRRAQDDTTKTKKKKKKETSKEEEEEEEDKEEFKNAATATTTTTTKKKKKKKNNEKMAPTASTAITTTSKNKKHKTATTTPEKGQNEASAAAAPAADLLADSPGADCCSFPMRRVWRLVRSEGRNANIDTRTTPDAVLLINKASEMFLEIFTEDAYFTAKKARRKTVGYRDLASIVTNKKRYEFLSDFVPEKVKAEDALKEQTLD